MNSISSLTITNPTSAHDMIVKLSGFLRYSLTHDSTQLIALKDEIQNMDSYVAIEKGRFGDKLRFEKDIQEDCLTRKVPFLILQPLIENSIKHGVYESLEPVTIKVQAKLLKNQFVEITIGNDFDPDAVARKGTSTGLKNIQDRMKLIYHLNDLFSFTKEENYFSVTLSIPPENLAQTRTKE